jgi:hypothetical protein
MQRQTQRWKCCSNKGGTSMCKSCECQTSFDPTKPVQFRKGKPARIICADRKDPRMPIVALYGDALSGEGVAFFRADGTAICGSPENDLVNVPERSYVFRTLGRYTKHLDTKPDKVGTMRFPFLEEAKRAWPLCKSFLKITVEEGVAVDVEIVYP